MFVIRFMYFFIFLISYLWRLIYWQSFYASTCGPLSVFSGSAHPRGYQANQVLTVELGGTVSLECSVKHDTILWFKQIAGHQPRIISVFQHIGETNFYNEFKDGRFQRSHFNLKISHINQSDAAVYHCGSKAHYVQFGRGAQLIVKGTTSSSAHENV